MRVPIADWLDTDFWVLYDDVVTVDPDGDINTRNSDVNVVYILYIFIYYIYIIYNMNICC